jgi:hypothetical protein
MNKNLIKIILVAIFAPIFVLAANVSIVFEKTPSLFSESSFMPGDSVARWITIQNIGSENKVVATQALNFANPTPSDDLARALLITIQKDGTDFYGGSLGQKTLYDFYQQGLIDLATITPGQTQKYDYIISFPSEKENEWQGKQTGFDIQIGYKDGTQDPGDPETHGGGGGGGGQPGSCINMIYSGSVKVINVTKNSATITWKTTCLTDSEVVYSDKDDSSNFSKTETNFGYQKSTGVDKKLLEDHSMDLTGLKPCTQYFFRTASKDLLAVSNQYSFTTPCDDVNEFGGPGGENNGTVAGASIKASEVKPEVKGILDDLGAKLNIPMSCSDSDLLPWILLAIGSVLAFIEYKGKKDLAKRFKEIGAKQNNLF